MAKDGTTVPEDSAQPRLIPSKPRPDQIGSAADPNYVGVLYSQRPPIMLQTSQEYIVNDIAVPEVLTGTGDTVPSQIDSKRLHDVPRGEVHDPNAKGSSRYEKHIKGGSDVDHSTSEGPGVDKAPGDEDISDEAAMDKMEKKA